MVTGAVGRYIKFAHRDEPTWIPPWSILVFGSILCHKGMRSVKGADIICSMNINGTQQNADLTNIALHFYAGKGYLSKDDAVTEPCEAYSNEGLYTLPPNSSVHQRTEQRLFDKNGSSEQQNGPGNRRSQSLSHHHKKEKIQLKAKEENLEYNKTWAKSPCKG